MKILFVQNYFYPAVRAGGPVFSTLYLAKGLVQLGVDISVFTINRDMGTLLNVPTDTMVEYHGIKVFFHETTKNNRYLFSPNLWDRLRREIGNYDLVHLQELWTFPILAASYWCHCKQIPYIISPHGSLASWCINYKFFKKWLYFKSVGKKILEGATGLHFTSHEEIENLSKKIPFRLTKFEVIPNPLDLRNYETLPSFGSFRRRWNISFNQPIVLFLGRLHPIKGIPILINAIEKVNEPEVMLVIVGPDENGYKQELQEMVSRLGVQNKVVFTGPLTGEDKLAAYRDSNLLALSSYNENFGMVVAEAMAAGLPVVISEHVNIAADVARKGAGLVLPLEPNLWADNIAFLLKHPEVCQQMGAAGKYFVMNEYSIQSVAEKLLSFYCRILNQE